ncbi:universal stress protein [Pedobacter panaciterrae]
MKKILVPTDFSLCASNAINFAVQSSRIFPSEITIIHVMELMNSVYGDYTGITVDYSGLLRSNAEEELATLKKQLLSEQSVSVGTAIYEAPVGENIVKAAIDKSADFVLMGTTGASGLKEKLWGSQSGMVIGKSTIPVLVIPEGYHWKKPEKILLATNNFEQDKSLLKLLMELVVLYDASLHIVVFTDDKHDNALTFFEHAHKIGVYKEFIREAYGYEVTANHIYGTELDEVLEDYVKTNEIDILAMITHKRKLFDRLFHPSLTKKMSFHTKIPLLAIPALT